MIVFIIMVIIGNATADNTDTRDVFSKIDSNSDGALSRKEFKKHMMDLEKSKSGIKSRDLSVTIAKGIIRGALMGIILGDFEGGVILALTLSAVNPFIHAVEKII